MSIQMLLIYCLQTSAAAMPHCQSTRLCLEISIVTSTIYYSYLQRLYWSLSSLPLSVFWPSNGSCIKWSELTPKALMHFRVTVEGPPSLPRFQLPFPGSSSMWQTWMSASKLVAYVGPSHHISMQPHCAEWPSIDLLHTICRFSLLGPAPT